MPGFGDFGATPEPDKSGVLSGSVRREIVVMAVMSWMSIDRTLYLRVAGLALQQTDKGSVRRIEGARRLQVSQNLNAIPDPVLHWMFAYRPGINCF